MAEIESTEFEEALAALTNRPAVFLLWPAMGKPLLARTNVLRRRLLRLLGTAEQRAAVARVEYFPVGSQLEARFLMRDLARQHLGRDYRREIRLRLPPYLKLVMTNAFPRTEVVSHLGRGTSIYFGPFRDRSTAVAFESGFLDLFQLRRCQENLAPSAEHAGCIYGEMGRCLRPCQELVSLAEYGGEALRVAEFLRSNGRSLLGPASAERERLSEAMDFEGAARLHERVSKIADVLALRDEMSREVTGLHAIAVTPSSEAGAVELGWLRNGLWHGFSRLSFGVGDATTSSLDGRIREMAQGVGESRECSPAERMENLAIVSRWFYSQWRDGELLVVDDWAKLPIRKLVNAVSRVANQETVAKTPQPLHPDTNSS